VRQVIALLAAELGIDLAPEVPGKFRAGDIRHCYADTGRIEALGFRPQVRLEDGVAGLVEWVRSQHAVDALRQTLADLERRTLVR
jgi:dTDP-L-rhamnose 4-epimerase